MHRTRRTVLAGGSYWYLNGSNTFSAMVGFLRLYCGRKSATTGVISHPSACECRLVVIKSCSSQLYCTLLRNKQRTKVF